jgi:hypothetical protein
MHRIIKTNLIKGIEQGVYRKEIDPEILSIYRLETSFVPFNPQLYPFSKFDIAKVTVQIIENFIYGVMSINGMAQMEKYKQATYNNSIDEESKLAEILEVAKNK